jgi:predicted extracellular nuclease
MRFTFILIVVSLTACGGSGGATITPIYDVQGSGASSPLDGQTVSVEGVVIGDFQDGDADDTGNVGGFYLQQSGDGDVSTSDGVFVFDGHTPDVDVAVGDRVRVSGEVQEHFGETQISADSVAIVGSGSLAATQIELPAPNVFSNSDGRLVADLERYEGMLIRFAQTLTVSELWQMERFGEVTLAQGGRLYQFTNQNSPDSDEYSDYRTSIAARQLVLDDGILTANASPIRYLAAGDAPDYSIRIGDQITDLTGVLRFSRGSGPNGTETYRLLPTIDPLFDRVNPRPGAPTVAGALRVASFNVLNFFSGIDSGVADCGPAGTANCRGADSETELARQLQKIVSALRMLNADVIGLIELENTASDSLQTLVVALNDAVGADSYDFIATGAIGTDAIKTGFIYKTATVRPEGAFAVLDSDVDARYDDTKNRPALAQTFAQTSNGAELTVIVNHFKSKGSDCDAVGDPNLGDGQGNCNVTRTSAATALAEWLATDPTNSADPDFLIIGDLNAYMFEDPVAAIRNAGFSNAADAMAGPEAYSFNFDAMSGALDHALTSPSLTPQVAGFLEWHINADEPPVLDYNLENGRDPALFDGATPYRASDHDPLVIGLDLKP